MFVDEFHRPHSELFRNPRLVLGRRPPNGRAPDGLGKIGVDRSRPATAGERRREGPGSAAARASVKAGSARAQLVNLKMELRDSGKVYSCLPGQDDDLAISCCMLAWARRHPHVQYWKTNAFADRMPRPPQRTVPSGGWT